ncbi:MAG: hypothetical protein R3B07_17715 [Polyangiaceae bacterium]
MTTILRTFLLLALLAALGCDRHAERQSENVIAPAGRFRNARIQVEYGPAFRKNNQNNPAHVRHTLVLAWPDVNESRVTLLRGTTKNLDDGAFSAARKSEYRVRFAPDGEALAVATDQSLGWRLVDLTTLTDPTKTEPLWCPHHVYESLEPWPASRELALEIFRAAKEGTPEAKLHRETRPNWPVSGSEELRLTAWSHDISGAKRYACQHREDKALREALIEEFFDGRFSQPDSLGCMGEIARGDAALIARLEAAQSKATDKGRKSLIAFSLRVAKGP